MNKRKLIRGEKHHWWPKCLSKHWVNERGFINRITPQGNVNELPPSKIARISNGHNFLMEETSPVDHTFEQEFDRTDADFPMIINWLNELRQNHTLSNMNEEEAYFTHNYEIELLNRLSNCMVSLVVRSPKFRNNTVLRGQINKSEQKRLIAANIRHKQEELSKSLNMQGKFIIFFSKSKEFIFGDGFYNNIPMSDVHLSHDVRILVPITPSMAVLYIRPMMYMSEPKLMSIYVDHDIVMLVNKMIQIYSKECLFYRAEKPILNEYFIAKKHLTVVNNDPIDQLIDSIPGVNRI